MSPPRRRPARSAPLDAADADRSAAGNPAAAERSATPARGSFGQWLRGQREARGVTLLEIAESSKISRRYLEALEGDRFEVLPAPVFVRGFLREYARVVGLDADEVVNLFLVSAPRPPAERGSESAGARSGPSPRGMSGGSSLGRGLLIAAGLVLLLGVAAGVAYWVSTRASAARAAAAPAASKPVPAPRADPPAAEPMAPSVASGGEIADPRAPATTGAGASLSPPELAPSVPAAATVPLAPIAPAPATASAAPVVARPMIVVLAFQQDCWVETRIDGGRRASELKAGGETLTLEAEDSIVLTLGNAPAVRAELNGRPIALPSDATRLLREFRIDRSLIDEPIPSERPQPSQP